jgi:enamine deaminase RidA (YjgF/YER057c/UK114 family)
VTHDPLGTVPGSPEARLAALGITLPPPARPVAAYIPTRLVGNLLYISGQVPFRDGKLIATGPVPGAVAMDQARECARQGSLIGLASELLVEIFGEAGRHTRAAVGSIALPLNAPVEVEMVLEIGTGD